MKRPTQDDVARVAKVSRSTVSIVLNNNLDSRVPISEETKQRVLQAVKDLSYAPNLAAQMLARGSGRLIGVFSYSQDLPSEKRNFFYPHLLGIEEEACNQDFNILLCTRGQKQEKRSIFLGGINLLSQADGSVLMGAQPDKNELRKLVEENYPFVFIGRREIPGCEIDWVASDYTGASAEATQYLFDLGHTEIAFLGIGTHESIVDRLKGVHSTVNKNPKSRLHLLPPESLFDLEGLVGAVVSNHISAILCSNLHEMIPIIKILHQKGISVPHDVSVLALGTDDASAWEWPDLKPTYMLQQQQWVGKTAVQVLISKITGEVSAPQQIIVPCQFQIGNTTGERRSR